MAYTTGSTIVAAFRNSSDAEAAARDLQSAGIDRDNIYLEVARAESGTFGSRSYKHEGGIAGWFKSMFGADDDDADRANYERVVGQGSCLLTVDVSDEQVDRVEDILSRHSPINVDTEAGGTSSSQASTAQTSNVAGQARKSGTRGAANTAESIPVVQEEIQVGKRRILPGGVRVYSRVIERPVEEKIGLQEERVRVERNPVDRPATAADLAGGKEQVIEVEEYAEQPVVSKQARVVEEVRVGKEVSQRTETVRDSVRRTEVEVEQLPSQAGGAGTSQYGTYDDDDFRRDFQTRYGQTGEAYEAYSPAYRYGYEMASDPRYKGRSFNDVESDLRSDYGRRYPNGAWETIKDSVPTGGTRSPEKLRLALPPCLPRRMTMKSLYLS